MTSVTPLLSKASKLAESGTILNDYKQWTAKNIHQWNIRAPFHQHYQAELHKLPPEIKEKIAWRGMEAAAFLKKAKESYTGKF